MAFYLILQIIYAQGAYTKELKGKNKSSSKNYGTITVGVHVLLYSSVYTANFEAFIIVYNAVYIILLLKIVAELCTDVNKHFCLKMKFSARGLDKKDLLGKSDPFLEFEKENVDGSYSIVYKTAVRSSRGPSDQHH